MRDRLRTIDDIDGVPIAPGEGRDLELQVSESLSGAAVTIPLHVRRGLEDGPVVFVTAALHGDEINGTGAIRRLVLDESLQLQSGALILVPVLNVLGFDRHSRYLPDRRDLNRCFPGAASGSQASRLAHFIFSEIIGRADYGIDLHTAAVRRTNVPTIRADLSMPEVARIAEAFGCELTLNGRGPQGALRREACAAGCPTVVLEGGEVWKVEPNIVECATRGVRNVLIELGMLNGTPHQPRFRISIETTRWVRAERGGFLQFHVAPGEIVRRGQPLASNTNLLGRELNVLTAPFAGVILGMTTLPAVSPGEPVCHLGKVKGAALEAIERATSNGAGSLHERVLEGLATSVTIIDP